MVFLFLIGSFISTYFVFHFKSKNKSGVRSAFLKASLVHGLLIVVSTELLSAISAFQFNFVLGFWIAAFLSSTALLIKITNTIQLKRHFADLFTTLNRNFKAIDAIDRICLATVGAILALTLTTAIVAPPNNMDSMSYHMPRVMHWIQNASISHYPTNTLRQISFPPQELATLSHTSCSFRETIISLMSFNGLVFWVAFWEFHLFQQVFPIKKGK